MRFQPDHLNAWLNQHHFSTPPVRYDLAASTGPVWTLRELLALDHDPDGLERLLDSDLSYVHSTGGQPLREAIAGVAGVEPAQVQVTTGGAEALWILFMLAAEPGANVVVPQRPSFPTFHEAPTTLGLEVRTYSMPRERDFAVDLAELYRLIDADTRLIVVNRPHNPTGAVMSDDQLEALHDVAVGQGIQLVVDEVFHPIHHGPEPRPAAGLPGATVVGDLSKALCLSGLRVGWIVERDRERLASYEQARSSLTVSSASLSEALAVMAVAQRDRLLARAQTTATHNLELLDEFFAVHEQRIGWVRPRGGLTCFPWLRSGESTRGLCEAALEAGILLAPGDCFGEPAHFRLGFGAAGERFPEAIERLDAVVGAG